MMSSITKLASSGLAVSFINTTATHGTWKQVILPRVFQWSQVMLTEPIVHATEHVNIKINQNQNSLVTVAKATNPNF